MVETPKRAEFGATEPAVEDLVSMPTPALIEDVYMGVTPAQMALIRRIQHYIDTLDRIDEALRALADCPESHPAR